MPTARITLFVEDLSRLAAALPEAERYPALEYILARGRQRRIAAETPNHLRYRLFGLEPSGHLPVAALTHVSATGAAAKSGVYWLRADPVTLRADMIRVFMTSCGLLDFDAAEREVVSRIVREALEREGIQTQDSEPPWCFPLEESLGFEFLPLHQALGLDGAEALPAEPEARPWKRLLTDIQVELHQTDVNRQRHESGRPAVNSVWFWGGGPMPERFTAPIDTVVSHDPVTRGLGVLGGSEVVTPEEWHPGDGVLLIDWVMASADALSEAATLEQVTQKLLEAQQRSRLSLDLVDGGGEAWRLEPGARYRFWQRPAPLARSFAGTDRR